MKTLKLIACAATIAVGLGQPSNATSQSQLNHVELGTLEHLEKFGAKIARAYKSHSGAWGVTNSHRKSGAGHDHYDNVVRTGDILLSWTAFPKSTVNIHMPNKLKSYSDALSTFARLQVNEALPGKFASLSNEQRTRFYEAATDVVRKRKQLLDSVSIPRSRRALGALSYDLTVEHKLFPLSLSVINGQLKLKFSKNVGGFKVTGTAYSSSSAQSNLKRAYISVGNEVTIFAIGEGGVANFDVPQSNVTIQGEELYFVATNPGS